MLSEISLILVYFEFVDPLIIFYMGTSFGLSDRVRILTHVDGMENILDEELAQTPIYHI